APLTRAGGFGSPRRCPHESQNLRPFGFVVPHFGQTSTSARGAAHSQNLALSRLSQPQLGHFTLTSSSRQFFEERLSILQVGRVAALAEPAVDLCQYSARFGLLALLLQKATQASNRAEFQ